MLPELTLATVYTNCKINISGLNCLSLLAESQVKCSVHVFAATSKENQGRENSQFPLYTLNIPRTAEVFPLDWKIFCYCHAHTALGQGNPVFSIGESTRFLNVKYYNFL